MKRTKAHEIPTLSFDLTILRYKLIDRKPGADLVFDVHGETIVQQIQPLIIKKLLNEKTGEAAGLVGPAAGATP